MIFVWPGLDFLGVHVVRVTVAVITFVPKLLLGRGRLC